MVRYRMISFYGVELEPCLDPINHLVLQVTKDCTLLCVIAR